MKTPKKISPDYLIDSIVQVVFEPLCSPELLLGYFDYIFKDTFKFIPNSENSQRLKLTNKDGIIIESSTSGHFVDSNKKVKISLSANKLVFNCINEYIGWSNYFPIVNKTINRLIEKKIISNVTRIGIRYISQFESIKIFEHILIDFSMHNINPKLETTQIRSEFKENEFKIILSLLNDVKHSTKAVKFSIIDIDIIQIFKKTDDIQYLLQAIENGHNKQKQIFFSLLKQEFINKLKPVY